MRILLAEDDAEMRNLLGLALEDAGFQARALRNGKELLQELERNHGEPREQPYRMIISDVRMPGATGLEVLEALRACEWSPPVILITAFGDPLLHEEARKLGALAVLDKPFDTDALVELVRTGLGASEQAP
jgi:DNA-binding response OmpR family regulator